MLYLETPTGFAEWTGQAIDGAIYPRSIEQNWTDEELLAIGLHRPFDPGIPEGHREVSRDVVLMGDTVSIVYVTEPIPPPHPRDRDLTKRQLRLGLYSNGFSRTFVQDVIDNIQDQAQRDIATIWWEDSPTISWDNPMTQQLIQASQLSEEAAVAMWIAAWELEE